MDKISALMDGELDEHQARAQLARLKQDEELARGWQTFHLIGDALRGDQALSHGFEQRLTVRLAGELTVLSPQRSTKRRIATFALSAAASLSAFALVGWVAFVNNPLAPQTELAKAPNIPTVAPASAQLANVPSDGAMKEYLIAHQEYSPSTAIQGLAPYIRGVSSTTQGQGR